MQTTRRGFLSLLALLPFTGWLKPSAPVAQGLKFHPNAFAFVNMPVNRFDVLYGFSRLTQNCAVRVGDYRGAGRPQISFAEWDARYQVRA